MSELKRNKPFRRSSNSSLSSRASNVSFSEKVRRESTAKFDNFMKECRAAYLAVLSSTTEKITSIDELILGKNYSVTFFQRELPEFFSFCSSFLAAITMELYSMPDYFQVLLMFSITVLVLYIFNLGMLFSFNSFYSRWCWLLWTAAMFIFWKLRKNLQYIV